MVCERNKLLRQARNEGGLDEGSLDGLVVDFVGHLLEVHALFDMHFEFPGLGVGFVEALFKPIVAKMLLDQIMVRNLAPRSL